MALSGELDRITLVESTPVSDQHVMMTCNFYSTLLSISAVRTPMMDQVMYTMTVFNLAKRQDLSQYKRRRWHSP